MTPPRNFDAAIRDFTDDVFTLTLYMSETYGVQFILYKPPGCGDVTHPDRGEFLPVDLLAELVAWILPDDDATPEVRAAARRLHHALQRTS